MKEFENNKSSCCQKENHHESYTSVNEMHDFAHLPIPEKMADDLLDFAHMTIPTTSTDEDFDFAHMIIPHKPENLIQEVSDFNYPDLIIPDLSSLDEYDSCKHSLDEMEKIYCMHLYMAAKNLAEACKQKEKICQCKKDRK